MAATTVLASNAVEMTAENPWRPVNWRVLRAEAIIRREIRTNRKSEDKLVWQTSQFLRKYSELETDNRIVERDELIRRNKDIYWALRINRMSTVRDEIEARMLAGQTDEEICELTQQIPSVITTYRKLAFDVTGRLKNKTFIIQSLLGLALHNAKKSDDHGVLWKFYAYTYGPLALEALAHASTNASHIASADQLEGTFKKDGRDSFIRKHMLAARLVEVSGFTAPDIFEGYARLTDQERKNELAAVEGADSIVVQALRAMLEALPVDVGTREQRQPRVDSKTLELYDSAACELPTPVLVGAAMDELPEDMPALLDLEYPEPINARIALEPATESDE